MNRRKPIRESSDAESELAALVNLVCSKDFTEFELEREGLRIRVVRAPGAGPHAGVELVGQAPGSVLVESVTGNVAPAASLASEEQRDLHAVKSPMVGTFYRSANPSGEPFVKVGDAVKKGQVICIVEAMKLMNEIECEVAGEIHSVIAENGQPVEYGEALFKIRMGD